METSNQGASGNRGEVSFGTVECIGRGCGVIATQCGKALDFLKGDVATVVVGMITAIVMTFLAVRLSGWQGWDAS